MASDFRPDSTLPAAEPAERSSLLRPPHRPHRDALPAEAVIELDWRRWSAAVLRHKWLVVVVTLVGTAGGLGVSRLLTPTYVVDSTLWIDLPTDTRQGDQGPSPIQSAQLLGPSGWVDLLKAHVVLDSVVDELRLYLGAKSAEDAAVLAGFRHKPQGFRPGTYRLDVADTGHVFTLSTAAGRPLQHGRVGDPVGRELGFDWVPP